MNTAVMTGHLVHNPEPKTIGERVVLNGTIAHNHVYKDKDGNRQEDVVFLDFEAWGSLAETISRYITTKRKVLLAGRLKLNRWEDEKGRHSQVVLVVESFEFMDAPAKSTTPVAAPGPSPVTGTLQASESAPF